MIQQYIKKSTYLEGESNEKIFIGRENKSRLQQK